METSGTAARSESGTAGTRTASSHCVRRQDKNEIKPLNRTWHEEVVVMSQD